MVGRTPEYLGKKIQAAEMKLVVALHAGDAARDARLRGGVGVLGSAKLASILNPGPHGLTEVLYAFTSAANNNGSAFAGMTGNTDWYNTTLGLAMLVGRFLLIIPVLAIAGSLARKQPCPATAGHVPDAHAAVRGPVRRDPHRRRPHLLPGRGARPHRRAPVELLMTSDLAPSAAAPERSPSTRAIVRGPRPRSTASEARPRAPMARNPVMFVVERRQRADDDPLLPGPRRRQHATRTSSPGSSPRWLWFTVLFANFAEAMAEGRGKAQAATLRKHAGRDAGPPPDARRHHRGGAERRSSTSATCASSPPARSSRATATSSRASRRVDESAITGESAPVIRESGGDRSAVTGGTRVLSDEIVVRITAKPGETFLDRMIALVEGAERQKTPERDRARTSCSPA